MVSDRTKDLKKKRNIYTIISYGLWITCALFLTIYSFCTLGGSGTSGDALGFLSEDAKGVVLGIGTTTAIGLIGTIIIKDKIRTAIWMASLVMATILFNRAGMFVILAIWLIDEYVINFLAKRYQKLLTINKEIDLRND